MIVAAFSPAAVRFLTTPVVAWLGRVSFSLYLVHEPIIVATAGLIGPGRQWLSIPLAMVAALLVAAVFYRYVELPAHRLARRVGSVGRRRAAEPATSA